jgi:hypothetical protein
MNASAVPTRLERGRIGVSWSRVEGFLERVRTAHDQLPDHAILARVQRLQYTVERLETSTQFEVEFPLCLGLRFSCGRNPNVHGVVRHLGPHSGPSVGLVAQKSAIDRQCAGDFATAIFLAVGKWGRATHSQPGGLSVY